MSLTEKQIEPVSTKTPVFQPYLCLVEQTHRHGKHEKIDFDNSFSYNVHHCISTAADID